MLVALPISEHLAERIIQRAAARNQSVEEFLEELLEKAESQIVATSEDDYQYPLGTLRCMAEIARRRPKSGSD